MADISSFLDSGGGGGGGGGDDIILHFLAGAAAVRVRSFDRSRRRSSENRMDPFCSIVREKRKKKKKSPWNEGTRRRQRPAIQVTQQMEPKKERMMMIEWGEARQQRRERERERARHSLSSAQRGRKEGDE